MGAMEISSYNLLWPNFTTYLTTSFKNLSDNDTFSDITLLCEKNKELKAHKAILAACSQFFSSILSSLPSQHTYFYVDGVSYQDLKDVISFMYLGQVCVEKESLDTFMAVCKKLGILGLSGGTVDELQTGSKNKEIISENDKTDEQSIQ